ncbi:MAG: DNA-processing protein DprA [Clostridia bacterium]|nr:DNA-processing protein DprA [Clostridia bacterium]
MSDIRYSVWLSLAAVPGTRSLCQLIEAFDGNTDAIYKADYDECIAKGAPKGLAERLADKSLDEADKIVEFCKIRDVFLLPYDSPNYPKRLRRIPDFPVLLYGRGAFPVIDNEVAIATVGTRRYTEYGKRNAYTICNDLARGGAIVVSGMASGIDTFCHRGALDALGYTIAVLGCGIDVVYPRHNAELMEEIAGTGTVLTEYPPHTEPLGYHFPKRNRIISALSLGTLVIEGDEKSGAMITARLALEQGRDIFSLPGNIGEAGSGGTNQLIKQGARMVTSAFDILVEYECLFPTKIRTERLLYTNPAKHMKNLGTKPASSVATPIKPIINDLKGGVNGVYTLNDFPYAPHTPPPTEKTVKPKKPKNTKPTESVSSSENRDSIKQTPKPIPEGLDETERKILELVPTDRAITTDELARKGFTVSDALVALTTLEIKQLVRCLPGGQYIRNT